MYSVAQHTSHATAGVYSPPKAPRSTPESIMIEASACTTSRCLLRRLRSSVGPHLLNNLKWQIRLLVDGFKSRKGRA